MPKKYTCEELKDVFEEKGCKLLSDEYINNSTKLMYICKCGGIYHKTLSAFKRSYRCKTCRYKKTSESQLYSYDFIKSEFEKRGCVLLEKEYKGAREPMAYICSCGNTSKIRYDDLRSGYRCRSCGGNRIPSLEEVREYFNAEGYTLISKTYENARKHLTVKCPNNHTYGVSFQSFKCGYRCQKCYFENNKGENNPNWNSNLTDEDRVKTRGYEAYGKWRMLIYEKDNFTCQRCDEKGGYLNAHHIFNYAEHKDLRLDINNGITLCEDCHTLFHRKYGYKGNNDQQIKNFINDYDEVHGMASSF